MTDDIHSAPQLPDVTERIARVDAWMSPFSSVVVAFSGGIDSALVLRLAIRSLGVDHVLAITATGPALAQREKEHAERVAKEFGARHRWVDAREIDNPDYKNNGPDRCFHCKSSLYRATSAIAREVGSQTVLNGTNVDDLGDYRPGLLAAEQANVRAPLAECGLSKDDVRHLAQALGISAWDKPASPCLASRIPYGNPVNRHVLRQVELVENKLSALGFRIFRARHFGHEVRIEVPLAEVERAERHRTELLQVAKIAGFDEMTVDPGGFVSGSLNRSLPLQR